MTFSKQSILIVALMTIFFSCKKNAATNNNNPVASKPDTLTAGWTIVNLNTTTGVDFADIYFYNPTVGYALGNSLWKSTDGGINWQDISGMQGKNLAVTQNGNVFVIPYYTGNGLTKSTDGGQNFSTIYINAPGDLNDIFFTGNDTGYITTSVGLLRTVDAGNNWAAVSTTGLDTGSDYYSMFFYNDNLGWICDSSNVYKTNGNITNWTKATIHSTASYVYVTAIFPTSASDIYLLTYSRELYKSTDGGMNFYLKSTVPSYPGNSAEADIHFIDDNTGYVSIGKRIYKTTDGGVSWQVVVALGENSISEIHFTDANHGWASPHGYTSGILLRYNQ